MEIEALISPRSVFFFRAPPQELLALLKELGLDFEARVVYCG